MNVMRTRLSHTKHSRGRGESFGVEVERSPIKGSRMTFLRTLVENVQAGFNGFE